MGGANGGLGIQDLLSGLGLSGLGNQGVGNFGCPYTQFSLAGLPALKGRFTGCCDRNLCYYPRTSILKQYSGIASYYAQWGAWGSCAVSCGGGRQVRQRKCVSINNEPCDPMHDGTDTEEKICNDVVCPALTNWAAWSSCSVSCGLGDQERYRECLPAGAKCQGQLREQQECAAPVACPVFGDWSEFSMCSSNCGAGQKTRSRPCQSNCDMVVTSDLVESVACYTVNGASEKVEGTCLDFPNCYMTVTYKCVKSDGSPGCCGNDFEERSEDRKCSQGTCSFCDSPQYMRFCASYRRGLKSQYDFMNT